MELNRFKHVVIISGCPADSLTHHYKLTNFIKMLTKLTKTRILRYPNVEMQKIQKAECSVVGLKCRGQMTGKSNLCKKNKDNHKMIIILSSP